MFPTHVAAVLEQYGIPAPTRAALYDLYCAYGNAILEVFADWVASAGVDPRRTEPDDALGLRTELVDRYVRENHPHWLAGTPTPSLYFPRYSEGRGAGLTAPLGAFEEGGEGIAGAAADRVRAIVGDDQPLPPGVLMVSREAHFGGRADTVSFDIVAATLDDARLLGRAEGRQHTLPGSAGETSGTVAGDLALIWEIQPNVLKPQDGRNREVAAIYRKHRNWHVATLAAAILWLRDRGFSIWILRGGSLSTTHEVNPAAPVSDEIGGFHDRTVARVVDGLGLHLADPAPIETAAILASDLPNTALRKAIDAEGAAAHLWRVEVPA